MGAYSSTFTLTFAATILYSLIRGGGLSEFMELDINFSDGELTSL